MGKSVPSIANREGARIENGTVSDLRFDGEKLYWRDDGKVKFSEFHIHWAQGSAPFTILKTTK